MKNLMGMFDVFLRNIEVLDVTWVLRCIRNVENNTAVGFYWDLTDFYL